MAPDDPILTPGLALRSSHAPDLGVPVSRIRRRDVDHPFHGVSGLELDTSTTIGRSRAFEPLLLPGQYFSHLTAAVLFGAPLPESAPTDRIDVSVRNPRTPPRGRGVRGHRVSGVRSVLEQELPLISAPDVFCQLGTVLDGRDLVAVGDHFVTGRRVRGIRQPARCQLGELRAASERHRGKRGAATVDWALERVRSGADSRPETWLRLLLVDAGLPEPELDLAVEVGLDRPLHPDLAYSRWRVVLEYEGDIHRTDAATWRRDIERRELFEAAGWRVIRVTAADVFQDPERFVARVRRILAAR